MSQQINLLNADLKKPKEWLTGVFLLRGLGVFTLLLCGLAGLDYQETNRLEKEHARWTQQAEEAKNNITQVTQQFPARQPSPLLQADIATMEEKIKARDQVFSKLTSGDVGRTLGFSPLLEAFARQTLKGLWLTGIVMNGAGNEMRISGKALSADLVPQYITRLSAEKALRGRSFTAFQVGQPEAVAAPVTPTPAAVPAALLTSTYVEFALTADKVAEPALAGKPTAEVKR